MDKYERMIQSERAFLQDRPSMEKNNKNPERIAESIHEEAGELIDAVWAFSLSNSREDLDEIGQEVADVIKYCISLSFIYGFDIYDEVMTKTAYNHTRFAPVNFQQDYKKGYADSKAMAKELKMKDVFYGQNISGKAA